jgi:hypothetical protein
MRIFFGITLFLALLISSCNKEPEACIEVNQSSVAVGGDIEFRSCSKRALSFIWTFNGPDGASANDIQRSEEWFTFQFDTVGTYQVSLQAFYRYSWLGAWDSASTTVTVN